MKILLTGGGGMVGRNIIESEEASNYQIFNPSSSELNLLDYEEITRTISLEKPDMIIHSAGRVGGIQANMNNQKSFLYENTQMGLNIVSAASSLGIKKFINIGSSCMYPRNAHNPINEKMILNGELEPTNEGYAIAKIVVSKLCEYVSLEDKNKIYRTIIPCNLYGRYDNFEPKRSHLLPAIIKKVHDAKVEGKKTVTVWGDGSVRREFMYAGDLADFIFFAIKNINKIPQNLNVGLGHDYSVLDYYKEVAKVICYDGDFIFDLDKPVGMKQKLVDIKELNSLGWSFKTPIAKGVEQTYKFYRENLNYGV